MESLPTNRVTSSLFACNAASTTDAPLRFNCCAVITGISNDFAISFNSLEIFFNSPFSSLARSAGRSLLM